MCEISTRARVPASFSKFCVLRFPRLIDGEDTAGTRREGMTRTPGVELWAIHASGR